VAACVAALAAPSRGGPAPASTPPLVSVTSEGVVKAVQEARGKVVLVNVWATWCDPCRHEFPSLLAVAREFTGRGFKLILVSGDFADQRPKVLQFLARQGVDFPSYLKDEDDMTFINTLNPRWSGALPATFLYDRSGKLREFWEGEASYETLAGKVGALFGSVPEQRMEGGPQ
jgi:thiol-disulfide isomerase/thioredoxin